ncbi:MAG: HD domain-containing protein [Planctomycetes bacterium]|nr:HD domain-containing protein [Planctomycetota bacterium]
MQRQQLEDFKQWFAKYAAGFYKDDVFVNANLKLKEEHTRRVCDEMNYLTESLGLSESQRLVAETIAIFHDLGRYEQFTKYRTFSDAGSVPHGPLAVEVLARGNVLDNIEPRQRTVIEQAIILHAARELADDLDEDIGLFARLIRDADKLDIYYLVTEVDTRPPDDPQASVMINWFPQGEGYSPEIIEAIRTRESIDYAMLKTHIDMRLIHLAWVYDLNFPATFAKIKRNRYFEKIIALLPADEDIAEAARQITAYRDERLARD